jgi:hypothetical protein
MIADYLVQLKRVDADHARMSQMVVKLWGMLGTDSRIEPAD